MNVLELHGLKISYGQIMAVKGIDLTVRERELVALIGANGAGKTTTLKAVAGMIPPAGGSIYYRGRAVTGKPSFELVREGLALVPEGRQVFGKLTVEENLELGAYARSDSAGIQQDLERIYERFPRLKERRRQTAGTLSGGERKMLAIGRALLGRPKLLMLDEPTEGVWIGVIEEIAERLKRLSHEMALILVEQHIELALDVAQHAYVMDRGHIALDGPAQSVKTDPQLMRHLAP